MRNSRTVFMLGFAARGRRRVHRVVRPRRAGRRVGTAMTPRDGSETLLRLWRDERQALDDLLPPLWRA